LAKNCHYLIQDDVRNLLTVCIANCIPLLIQQNVDGSDFFNRSWAEFKVGFNDTRGNFWLGNELLSQLTLTGRYKLKFDLQSRANPSNWYYAHYNTLSVLSEATNYRLQVSGYSGNAGRDSFSWHNGMMFTTYDRDNDRHPANCAALRGGGFWHDACFFCGVNTAYGFTTNYGWKDLPGGSVLQSSRMWLQCN